MKYSISPQYFSNIRTYTVLFFVLLALINIRQSKSNNYNCEICADKAGYYIFLPAVFQNGFYANHYPDDLDAKHGNGFRFVDGKVVTKFTDGVAILQAPFYGTGVLIARILAQSNIW